MCYDTNSCYNCMPADNRYVDSSGLCVCKSGFSEDLSSSTCISMYYYLFNMWLSVWHLQLLSIKFNEIIIKLSMHMPGPLLWCRKCSMLTYILHIIIECDTTCKLCDGPSNNNCINCDISIHRYLNDDN